MTATARALRILQVDSVYGRGGAAGIAAGLVRGLRERAQTCWHLVGYAEDAPSEVIRLDVPRTNLLSRLAGRLRDFGRSPGLENFDFPKSRRLLELVPQRPDVVHCHNLHGEYFDLRFLPELSRRVPTFMTLHDAWLLSGHCAHSFECDRWRTGCGRCPDLSIPPAIPVDRTADNWTRKSEIYRHSRLLIATPSHWLMRKVEASMLAPGAVDAKVIPNGVDLATFVPATNRASERRSLGLDPDEFIVTFAAHGIRKNAWKDIATLRAALGRAAAGLSRRRRLRCLAVGEAAPTEQVGGAEITFVPYLMEPEQLARYYRVADVYVHAARADTFPTTVLEALASGTPVIATAVGGIPEQVRSLSREDGALATGILTPPGDAESMGDAIVRLAFDGDLSVALGRNARRDAVTRFDVNRQCDEYLNWYRLHRQGSA